MRKVTREMAKGMAQSMTVHASKEFVLYDTGLFGVIRDGKFKTIFNFGNDLNEGEVLWKGSVKALEEKNADLGYKTHLANYLYQNLNKLIQKTNSKGLTGNPKIDKILRSEKYQNYLKNQEIELTKNTITDTEIIVQSDTTSHAHHTILKFYTQEELLSLHEEARSLAVADSRAKIGRKYVYKKVILNEYDAYREAYEEYMKDFLTLGNLWRWKLVKDGLHYGLTDDEILTKVIQPIDFRIQRMSYNDGIIREFNRMVWHLEETIEKTKNEYLNKYNVIL